ncbi:hypothetical protein ABH931_007445 [Streptacidiphilus sp. MAP12-33]|uniref:hypothetical protein n=1 Tax=Streptacidiphilus sp. MAP12-33 TaxID=3156266 RepID=UPI0035174565
MRFTVPPPPLDLAEHFPDLLPHARSTTLLYPRAGAPSRQESSLGGPLLWPANEPWPMCSASGHCAMAYGSAVVGPAPVAAVPVLQLFARDVPALIFPVGRDVLQVLWCPLVHDEGDQWCPVPMIRWRSSVETAAEPLLDDAPQPYEFDEDFLPRACSVHPAETVEYPNWDMPQELSERVGRWSEEMEQTLGISYFDAFSTSQSKVGGYPGWTQSPQWPDCACGERMEHLVTVSASESCGRWLPVEERTGPGSGWDHGTAPEDNSHGMDMGDMGGVYIFVCRSCPGWPTAHRYDC